MRGIEAFGNERAHTHPLARTSESQRGLFSEPVREKADPVGHGPAKKVKGRKRHAVVDPLGLTARPEIRLVPAV